MAEETVNINFALDGIEKKTQILSEIAYHIEEIKKLEKELSITSINNRSYLPVILTLLILLTISNPLDLM